MTRDEAIEALEPHTKEARAAMKAANKRLASSRNARDKAAAEESATAAKDKWRQEFGKIILFMKENGRE